jgi:O-antigen/teichoic acid export membrane protein
LIVGAAAAGDWVVPLIFGESYRAAGSHLIYGMMLVLPFGVATIANQILIAHDRAWQAMAASVLGAAAMTFFVLGFMPTGGTIAGYLLRVFAGISVWAITALVLLGRRVPLNWSQCLVKPALASGIALGLYYILVGPLGAWVSLVVSMLTLIALHRVLNIVDRQERAALSRYLLARTGR